MKSYDHKKIEKKWKAEWIKKGVNKTREDDALGALGKNGASKSAPKPKAYVLDMFPYPSGTGLHVGHPRGYIATDVFSRFKTMNGYNILHPMGWDAFGLPAEEYAIKNKIHPSVAVKQNIKTFKGQLSILGLNYDWSREINTTDPEYYKWTQWAFLQMHKKGLTHESHEPINWCPSCKTGLANEDLEDGKCERCGSVVEKKPIRQWVIQITKYADRLLADLDGLKWPESVKESQRNWIGRSDGAEIDFKVMGSGAGQKNGEASLQDEINIKIFTTCADTLFGVTYLVLAPESPLIEKLKPQIKNFSKISEYIELAKSRTTIERTAEGKEKTGVKLEGVHAINPANNEPVEVWVADYVLADYGTGAVMAVPAHDERDYAFAKKYGLGVKSVIANNLEDKAFTGQGKLINSDKFDGQTSEEAREKITLAVGGKIVTRYKLRDWVFSRQRYWGEPIPLVHCLHCADQSYKGKEKISLSFYKKQVWDAILSGKKTIETRALNPEEKAEGRYFADIKEGDIIRCVNKFDKKNNSSIYLMVRAQKQFKNIGEAFVDKDFLIKANSWPTVAKSVKEMEQRYDTLSPNYLEKINKNGLIAWEFDVLSQVVPLDEKDLPLKLPNVKSYEPTGTGESPLAGIDKWVNTKCPACKGPAKRETNTMPQWAGSCWYYLRFIDPHNKKALIDPVKEKYWMPVETYVGGAEHATRHLIYARFWHKFLYDIGVVSTKEPFIELKNQGLIGGPDGRKMSKRYGNVVNPDDIVKLYGADTLRVYEMFMGPFDQGIAWSTDNMIGSRRFIEKIWRLGDKVAGKIGKNTGAGTKTEEKLDAETESLMHKTIKKVGEDIESFSLNTAISTLMIFVNALEKFAQQSEGKIPAHVYEVLLKLVAPFAPHIADELWTENFAQSNKGVKSIHLSEWPKYEATKLQSGSFKIVVQINSKVRATFESSSDEESIVVDKALALPEISSKLGGKKPDKVFYVKGKLLNLVINN